MQIIIQSQTTGHLETLESKVNVESWSWWLRLHVFARSGYANELICIITLWDTQ